MQVPFHLPFVESYTDTFGEDVTAVRLGCIVLELSEDRVKGSRPWWNGNVQFDVKRRGNTFKADGCSFNFKNIGLSVAAGEMILVEDKWKSLISTM